MRILPPLSESRVQQICNETDTKQFYRELQNKYHDQVSKSDFEWIKKELVILRKMDRSKYFVIRRQELIKYLYDELSMPFYKIGRLLKRDPTTIMNSYYERS